MFAPVIHGKVVYGLRRRPHFSQVSKQNLGVNSTNTFTTSMWQSSMEHKGAQNSNTAP